MTILIRNAYMRKPLRRRVPKIGKITLGGLFWYHNLMWRVIGIGREGSTIVAHIRILV
jgi:hypothetical protein